MSGSACCGLHARLRPTTTDAFRVQLLLNVRYALSDVATIDVLVLSSSKGILMGLGSVATGQRESQRER